MTDKTQEASHTSAPVDYTRDAEPPWSSTVREPDDPCGCQDSVELRAEVKRLHERSQTFREVIRRGGVLIRALFAERSRALAGEHRWALVANTLLWIGQLAVEGNRKLASERDALHMTLARMVGHVQEADGRNDAPGPLDDILKVLNSYAETVRDGESLIGEHAAEDFGLALEEHKDHRAAILRIRKRVAEIRTYLNEARAEVERLRQTRSTGEAFAALEIERNQLRTDVQRLQRQRDEAVHLLRLISDVDGEEDDLVKLARMADLECNCENDRAKEAEAKLDRWRPVIGAAKAWHVLRNGRLGSGNGPPLNGFENEACELSRAVDALNAGTSDEDSERDSWRPTATERPLCETCAVDYRHDCPHCTDQKMAGVCTSCPDYESLPTAVEPEPERLRGTVPVRHERPVIAECRMPLVAPEPDACATCGGTREVYSDSSLVDFRPCPDCEDTGRAPEQKQEGVDCDTCASLDELHTYLWTQANRLRGDPQSVCAEALRRGTKGR